MEVVEIKRVIAMQGGFAVLIGNERKTFPIYVGPAEGLAMIREIRGEASPRPLTHDLLGLVLDGFDIRVKRIVVSSLTDATFYGTLVLEQGVPGEDGEWSGKRNEVRVDARPSDCLVLALKNKVEVCVDDGVFAAVTDVGSLLEADEQQKKLGGPPVFDLDEDVDFDFDLGSDEGDSEP